MKETPLISIVVPMYNAEAYIEKCLVSIISQSYKNIEIIINDDGSTDKSIEIVAEYQKKDSRIICIHSVNSGWPKISRDIAYDKCLGDWVIPIDADDFIDVDYIENLWKRHLETGADFVASKMTLLDDNNVEYGYIPDDNFDLSLVIEGRKSVLMTIDGWTFGGNGALFSKSLLKYRPQSYPPEYTDETDTRYILYNAKNVAFSEAKYFYNYNPNSVVRSNSRKVRYLLRSQRGLVDFVRKYYSEDKDTISRQYNQSFFTLIGTFRDMKSIDRHDKYIIEDYNLWILLLDDLKGCYMDIGGRSFIMKVVVYLYLNCYARTMLWIKLLNK